MALNKNSLLSAYRRMSEIRAFEDRLHEENATGDIPGFIHLYSGQEAIAVGVCENLQDTDYIGSTHRGHGHCIAKGCDLHGMMAEIFGKDDGLCHGKGGSMHIADLSVGMLGANAIVGGAPSWPSVRRSARRHCETAASRPRSPATVAPTRERSSRP